MATALNKGKPPVDSGYETIHYLSARVTVQAPAVTVGTLPANAMLIPIPSILVTQAFNAGGTNSVVLGHAANVSAYGNVNVATGGYKAFSGSEPPRASQVTVNATYVQTGTPATAGSVEIVLAFANLKPQGTAIPPVEPEPEPPVPPTDGIPAGVALVPIDGGSTYYASNGFTYAANAGYDSTMFPFIGWLPGIGSINYVKTFAYAGVNAILGISSTEDPNTLTYMGPAGVAAGVQAPGVYFIQGLYTDNSFNSQLAAAGAETVGFIPVDEPGKWNATDYKDFAASMKGTQNSAWHSAIIPAGFQVGRFCYLNWQHAFTDNPWDVYSTYFPALPGGVNFSTGGPMTPGEMLYTTVPDRDGAQRHIDVSSIDQYWYTTGFYFADGVMGGAAGVFGDSIWKYGTSNTAPGSFACQAPQDITFATNSSGTFYGPNIDGGATVNHQAVVMLSSGAGARLMQGAVTSYTYGTPGSMTVHISQVYAGGSATLFTDWSVSQITLSPDQSFRGCHYGDQIDAQRGYQFGHPTAPIFSICESGDAGWGIIVKAVQMKAAAWCSIIHGARGIVWFQGNYFVIGAYQAPQGSDTISIFDQGKALHYLVQALTPVILSKFADGTPGYVSVKGDNLGGSTAGFRAPWRPSDHGGSDNVIGPYAYTPPGRAGCPNFNFNRSLVSAFEVMAKYYEGPTQTINGVTLTNKQFWIFADYRGSADDGSLGANANTLNATFTIANTGSSSVTRVFSDAVISATTSTSGTRTKIRCGDTSQMQIGDTVIIAGTSGISGLNGTWTIQSSNFTATTFDVPVPFTGALTYPSLVGGGTAGGGTIIALHNIPVTGGTTFTDTFTRGSDIRIYRVN